MSNQSRTSSTRPRSGEFVRRLNVLWVSVIIAGIATVVWAFEHGTFEASAGLDGSTPEWFSAWVHDNLALYRVMATGFFFDVIFVAVLLIGLGIRKMRRRSA